MGIGCYTPSYGIRTSRSASTSANGTCSHSMAAEPKSFADHKTASSHAPHSARVSRPSSSCSPAGPGQATVADCLSMLERLRCHQAKGKFTSTARIIQSTWLLTHHNRQLFSQLPYCRLSMNQAETESPLNGFTKTSQRNGSISPSFMHSLKDTDPQLLDGQFKTRCCWSGVLPSMPGFLVVTLSMITISALLGLRSLSYRS